MNNVHFSFLSDLQLFLFGFSSHPTVCITEQVVKAKVIKCDPENEKLLLSFKAVTQNDLEKISNVKFDFEIGKVKYH